MAYVVNVTTTGISSGTSFSADIGVNQENDLILVFLAFRSNGTPAVTGFTGLGTKQNNDAWDSRWFVKIAGAGGETSPACSTSAGAASGIAIVYVIRDADVSGTAANAIDATGVGFRLGSTAATLTSAALTPTLTNSLILHSAVWDQTNIIAPFADLNILSASSPEQGWNAGTMSGSTFKATAAAISTFTFTGSNGSNAGTAWAIAVKNGSSGSNPLRLTDSRSYIHTLGGFSSPTISAPNVYSTTTINSIATHNAASTAAYGQPASVPWGISGRKQTIATNLGAAAFVGEYLSCSSTDVNGKIISLPYGFGGTVDNTRIGAEGMIVVLASSADNWVAYQVLPQKYWISNGSGVVIIRPGTTTAYATQGTVDLGAIVAIGYLHHRLSGTTASIDVFFSSPIIEVSPTIVVGGGTSGPIVVRSEALYLLGGLKTHLGVASFQGSGQFLNRFGLQYGDGTNLTNVDHKAQSSELPNSAETQWRVGASGAGVTIYASASDVMDFSSSIFSAESAQTFTIHASSSLSAEYNFTNTAFQGWTVTDNAGISWTSTAFKSGGTVTIAGGGDLTNCTIRKTTSTNAALAITGNGSTLDGCTIDGTGAAYALELGTAVTAITLTDCTITAGSTDKVHVLKTTGTVTITISGTTSLVDGDVTSAGATVDIVAPQPTLDATVLSGTRVVLYNNTTAAELDNTAPAGTAWSKVITSGVSANDNLTLFAFKEGYAEFSTSFLYSGDDTTILVTQVVDDVVAAFRTEDSITDYTTLTEYNIYAPTIYIQADDADGVSKISRLATYYNGVLTTEDGARYFRGGMSMISTGAVRINKGTIELLLENVSATKSLRFSDEATRRLYTDDGTSIIAPSSVAGSIEYAYGGVPDTVAVGSAVLQADIDEIVSSTTSSVFSTAQTTPIHSDVRKVVGITVDGTGTEGDPWGPA